jgi:hypothetical protein
LGEAEVDPDRLHVLFERFTSRERNEPPDIDIDIDIDIDFEHEHEHERRGEVIQYRYAKYGRERAALTATVISYRPRSVLSDVGKALGLPAEMVDAIAQGQLAAVATDGHGGPSAVLDSPASSVVACCWSVLGCLRLGITLGRERQTQHSPRHHPYESSDARTVSQVVGRFAPGPAAQRSGSSVLSAGEQSLAAVDHGLQAPSIAIATRRQPAVSA